MYSQVPRAPPQVQQQVDQGAADEDVSQSADAETLPAGRGDDDDHRSHNDGGCAVGHAEGLGHALLEDAPWFQSDVCLEHHGDAHGAYRQPAQQHQQAAHVFPNHSENPSI